MKAFTKKIAVSVVITAITATMTGNIYAAESVTIAASICAAEPEVKAYVQVESYDYVIEYGLDFTEIDGEKYIVINLDDFMPNDVNISNSNYLRSQENYSVLSTLADKRELYSDTVNLTYGDYSTPTLNCSPSTGFFVKSFNALFERDVKVCMHMYSGTALQWVSSITVNLRFSAFLTEPNIIIVGEPAREISKCRLEIFKNGTTLESPFSYTLYEY